MGLAMRILKRQLAKMLDHTLVKLDVTKEDDKKCVWKLKRMVLVAFA